MRHDPAPALPGFRSIALPGTLSSAALALGLALVAGCGPDSHTPTHADAHADADTEHATPHRHASPHGGTLVELGQHQFQLDALHDPAEGTLKVWIMDGHAEAFVRITARALDAVIESHGSPAPVSLVAQADTATGETVGDTSHFLARNPVLVGLTNPVCRIPRIEVRGAVFNEVRFQCSTSR